MWGLEVAGSGLVFVALSNRKSLQLFLKAL
jgi:hypothetical protein